MKMLKKYNLFLATAISIVLCFSSCTAALQSPPPHSDLQLQDQVKRLLNVSFDQTDPCESTVSTEVSEPSEPIILMPTEPTEAPIESQTEMQEVHSPLPATVPQQESSTLPPAPSPAPVQDWDRGGTFTGVISVNTVAAPGIQVQHGPNSTIDFSNARYGYVMVRKNTDLRVRVRVTKGDSVYLRYVLPERDIFFPIPLQLGSGTYQVEVLLNVPEMGSTAFTTDSTVTFDTDLIREDSFALFPGLYANFNNNSTAVRKAHDLTVNAGGNDLKKVQSVYNWIINHITYDHAKAAVVTGDYIPNPDQVLAARKGICFDYASLMTTMLRSVGVPARLIIGPATNESGTVLHAWVEVYISNSGWISDGITTDGNRWVLLDPTYGVSGSWLAANTTYIRQEMY